MESSRKLLEAIETAVTFRAPAGQDGEGDSRQPADVVIQGLTGRPDLLLDPLRQHIARLVAAERHAEAEVVREGHMALARALRRQRRFDALRQAGRMIIDLPGGGTHRLTTCTPGMLFGEMAILERRPRSADVRADGPVECYSMTIEAFDRLTSTHPDLKVKLLENFANKLALRVRKLTDEILALSD